MNDSRYFGSFLVNDMHTRSPSPSLLSKATKMELKMRNMLKSVKNDILIFPIFIFWGMVDFVNILRKLTKNFSINDQIIKLYSDSARN